MKCVGSPNPFNLKNPNAQRQEPAPDRLPANAMPGAKRGAPRGAAPFHYQHLPVIAARAGIQYLCSNDMLMTWIPRPRSGLGQALRWDDEARYFGQ